MNTIKTIFNYWRIVFHKAWTTAWTKSGMRNASIAVLIPFALLIFLLLLNILGILPESLQILIGDFSGELRVSLVGLLGVILFALVILLFAVIYMPAMIFREQEANKVELMVK